MRLNKFIANNSQYSRRKADELIAAGRIFINGSKVTTLGTTIDPTNDQISIEDKLINTITEEIYIALNKPTGYVTTRSSKHHDKTVMDLLPKIPNLKPVGRLDKDSEGLIFASTDGEFINRLTHPKFECEKEYYVEVTGQLTYAEKSQLESGIQIEGKKTSPAKIKITRSTKAKTQLRITIHEGRNRQIRKMFASVHHPVKYLRRIRIGSVKLGQLRKGKYRKLTAKEVHGY